MRDLIKVVEKKILNKKLLLFVTLSLVLMLPFVSADWPVNLFLQTNSSDFWDNLDVPSDIPGSEFWYNFSLIPNAGDTNETTRFGALVDGDCSGSDKMIGIQTNGTALCTSTAGGGDFSFTDFQASFNLNVTALEHLTSTQLNNSYALIGSGGNLSFNETLTNILYLKYKIGTNGAMSTGILSGGLLSVNGGDTTKFDLSSGSGFIVNSTDVLNPEIIEVSWTAFTAETPTFLTTNLITFVSIDSNGAIVQQTTRWTNSQFRTEIILGVLVHVDQTVIDTVNNEHSVVLNPVSQIADIFEGLGFINVNGNKISSDGANLKVDKSEGVIMNHGINYFNDPMNPHHLTLTALNQASFQYRVQNGSNFVTGTDVDPDNYDVAGTLTAVGNNKFTIQRFYSFTSNNLKVLYGQNEYSSINDAKAGLGVDSFVTEPSILANGILRGFLIVKKGNTDLSDNNEVVFIDAGKFGQPSGTGGVGGGGTISNLSFSTISNSTYGLINVGNATFIQNLTQWDCTGSNFVQSIANNGTVVCGSPAGSGDFSFTDFQASFDLNNTIWDTVFNTTFDFRDSDTVSDFNLIDFQASFNLNHSEINFNPFNQQLNTTFGVQFNSMNISGGGINISTQGENLTIGGSQMNYNGSTLQIRVT